jgi:hypothetical protein
MCLHLQNWRWCETFDVISARFNGYQTSRHHTTEDINTEMNVVGIYVNRNNTQKWIINLCNYTTDIFLFGIRSCAVG